MSRDKFIASGVFALGFAAMVGYALSQSATPAMAAEDGPGANLVIEVDGATTGKIVIDLLPDVAPKHVAQITALAEKGAYDDVVFHRVIDGFMAQVGCPNGVGTGGSSHPDLKAEFNAEPHVRGICSMARSQNPNSANSQFFIVFDDARFLDKQYTVWGEVIEGMDNVDALPKGEPPREPGKIVKATVS